MDETGKDCSDGELDKLDFPAPLRGFEEVIGALRDSPLLPVSDDASGGFLGADAEGTLLVAIRLDVGGPLWVLIVSIGEGLLSATEVLVAGGSLSAPVALGEGFLELDSGGAIVGLLCGVVDVAGGPGACTAGLGDGGTLEEAPVVSAMAVL